MGLFHKNKQKEALQEVKQPQISLEEKAYPIIYTANAFVLNPPYSAPGGCQQSDCRD